MSDYFNAVERLEKFYGNIPDREKSWIEDNIETLSDEQKGKFFKVLTTVHEFKNGYPEVSVMADVFKKVMNKAPKSYAWSVCKECGCEYDYKLPCCPACYEKGFYCNTYAVKSSDSKPAIIQFNKTYLNGGNNETTCFNCVHKKDSFCKNFGNNKWNCKREEFEACECRTCCSLAKRENARIVVENKKGTYAIPLKKV